MAEDDYADALLRYWATVKEAEGAVAPFLTGGARPSHEQRAIIADVVRQVRVAEDAYFSALEAAGRPVPPRTHRSENS